MVELQNGTRIAVVTGASRGIGASIAEALGRQGRHMVLVERSADKLEVVKSAIESVGGTESVKPCDVTDQPALEAMIESVGSEYKRLDILVNNAGKSAAAGLEEIDDAEWQADINLKVMAAVRACRRVIPIMRERGGGAIVNATIVGGKAPAAKSLPTTVSRAAGINLTKSLANEYAVDRIRVNTVCIGLLKSEQWVRRAGNEDPEELYRKLSKQVPLGRIGEAEEYADLVTFLVSDRAAYLTGVAVNIYGGLSDAV